MTAVEGLPPRPSPRNRKAIPVTCALHRGPRDFANLMVERKPNGEIVLDVHVTGMCVIIFSEEGAQALFTVLGKWLGCKYWGAPCFKKRDNQQGREMG